MKLRSVLILTILAATLTLTSCASNKKSTEGVDNTNVDTTTVDNANNSGALDLNGDSDAKRAGALQTVYFDYNSAAISSSTRDTLNDNVKYLKANPTVKVQVEGHCDERGSIQFNLALGEKRAKSVRDFLASQGIASGRISVISLGKEKPVAFGHDEDAWSQNRRGNFVVTAK